MVSPVESRFPGNVVTALTRNQSDPTYVASRLAVPCDLGQAILRVAGKALLLLG